METNRTGGIAFVMIPYDVFRDPGLTPTEKLAIGRLQLYAGKGGRCYPSHDTLAGELCFVGEHRRRSALALLKSLRKKGWISWERTGGSNSYKLLKGSRCDANITSDVTASSHRDSEPDAMAASHQIRLDHHIGRDVAITEKEVLRDLAKEEASGAARNGSNEICVSVAEMQSELGRIREAFPNSELARSGRPDLEITRKIVGRLNGCPVLGFAQFIAWRFKKGRRSPYDSTGPKGWGLFLEWAGDYAAMQNERPAARTDSGGKPSNPTRKGYRGANGGRVGRGPESAETSAILNDPAPERRSRSRGGLVRGGSLLEKLPAVIGDAA
jgi:hypothetical protein